ncbi:MAG: hypothetical protein WCY93_12245 [Anaerolineaceae bacterium]
MTIPLRVCVFEENGIFVGETRFMDIETLKDRMADLLEIELKEKDMIHNAGWRFSGLTGAPILS